MLLLNNLFFPQLVPTARILTCILIHFALVKERVTVLFVDESYCCRNRGYPLCEYLLHVGPLVQGLVEVLELLAGLVVDYQTGIYP